MNRAFDISALCFADFVGMLARPPILNADIHWRPQVHFLIYENYDAYLQFETLDAGFETLKEAIDLDVTDTRGVLKHDTHKYTLIHDTDFSDTPAKEILALQLSGHCPAHMSLYTPALKEKVRKIYHQDFDLYERKFGAINDS